MPIFQPNIQKLTNKNDIDGLIRAIRYHDPQIRRNAVSALAGFRDPRIISTFFHTIRDENRDVRLETVVALGKLKSPTSIHALIQALNDHDPLVRMNAIWALGEIKVKEVVNPIIFSMADPDKNVRIKAAEIITNLGRGVLRNPSSIQALSQTLRNPDPSVRAHIVRALGEIGGIEVVRPVILSMGDVNKHVRIKAVEAVISLGSTAYPELKKAIKGRNPLIRRNVITTIGRIGDMQLVPQVLNALVDPEPAVRKNAIWALGRMSTPRAVPHLERLNSRNAKIALQKIKEGPNWRIVAQNYEKCGRFEDAADLYEMKGEWEEAGRLRKKAREPIAPRGFAQVLAENLHLSSETIIKDSVISRSSIGQGETTDSVISRNSIGQRKARDSVISRNSIGQRKARDSVISRNGIEPSYSTEEDIIMRKAKEMEMKDDRRTRNEYNICPFCGMELKFSRSPKFCPYCAERLE